MVKGISLTVILGPSGCGKTITLRMIADSESRSGGQIFIDCRGVTLLGPAERNVKPAEMLKRAKAAMSSVGLSGFDDLLLSELSGGQQQRMAMARALLLEPAVLLFDEPPSNLDARLRRSMYEGIRLLQQRLGLTVAHVTHDQSEALAMSDQIIVMVIGVMAQAGSPADLHERPQS